MKSKVVNEQKEIDEIIGKCDFCNMAMVDDENKPYLVPMNFGFRDQTIYLHSSRMGKKIDILTDHPDVCLSFSTDHQLRWQSEKVACSYSMRYRSVLVYGKVHFIEDFDEKVDALNIIMANYTDRKFSYNDPAVKEVMVFKVIADKFEGREYGY